MITTTPMGPGFFIFFQTETGVSSSGGDYRKKKYRILKPLKEYEHEIRKLLEEERIEKEKEADELKVLLAKVEVEKIKAEKEEEIRQTQEIELKYLLISESLLQIERDLAEIERKRAEISLRARIMLDDDELMILIYG